MRISGVGRLLLVFDGFGDELEKQPTGDRPVAEETSRGFKAKMRNKLLARQMEQQMPCQARFPDRRPAARRIKQDHVAYRKLEPRLVMVERRGADEWNHRAVILQPVETRVLLGALNPRNIARPVERHQAMY